jgi:hypothetical protein
MKRESPIGFTRLIKTMVLFFGFNPKIFLFNIKGIPRYLIEYSRFRKLGGEIDSFYPILIDYGANAGSAKGCYFHQDLLVAQFIYQTNPKTHIDIGSRIDGFVAHVASFRELQIIDVRKLEQSIHSNIKFQQMNASSKNIEQFECDSLSCLNAIEHFGLGRFGDDIDPLGHLKGFENMVNMLSIGGFLYISFPITTRKTKVFFNAHRRFNPLDIFDWPMVENLELIRFDYVDDYGNLHVNIEPKNLPKGNREGCGIYSFKKIKNFSISADQT